MGALSSSRNGRPAALPVLFACCLMKAGRGVHLFPAASGNSGCLHCLKSGGEGILENRSLEFGRSHHCHATRSNLGRQCRSGQPDPVDLDLITLHRAVVLDRRSAEEDNIPFDMILRDSQPLVHVG